LFFADNKNILIQYQGFNVSFFRIIFLFVVFISLTINSYSQEQGGESDLRKAADRMKYENALQFYNLKKYSNALNQFHEYLEVYYNGNHRDQAYLHIADIHMLNFRYTDAVKVYDNLFREYSNSETGVNAYYSKGICYMKMGYETKAEEVFNYIITRHPGTKAAVNSEIQLELLKISSN